MIVTQKEFCNLCGNHITCGCHGPKSYDFQGHMNIWNAHHKICTREFQNALPEDFKRHVPELCKECLQDRCACGKPRHCGTKTDNCFDCNCILCIENWKKNELERIQKLSNAELFDDVTSNHCNCTGGGGTWEELDQWSDQQKEMALRDKLRDWLHG